MSLYPALCAGVLYAGYVRRLYMQGYVRVFYMKWLYTAASYAGYFFIIYLFILGMKWYRLKGSFSAEIFKKQNYQKVLHNKTEEML